MVSGQQIYDYTGMSCTEYYWINLKITNVLKNGQMAIRLKNLQTFEIPVQSRFDFAIVYKFWMQHGLLVKQLE